MREKQSIGMRGVYMSINSQAEQRAIWKIDHLDDVLAEIENRMESANEKRDIKAEWSYPFLVFTTLAKSLLTMRGTICLAENGLPEAAFSLARNLYEQSVILEFLNSKCTEENFEDYINDYYVDIEWEALADKKGQLELTGASTDEISEIDKKITDLKKQLKISKCPHYSWASTSRFAEIEKAVHSIHEAEKGYLALLHQQHSAYKIACHLFHANGIGNVYRLANQAPEIVDVSPNPEMCGHALLFAVMSFIPIAGISLNVLSASNEDILSDLNRLAKYYHENNKEFS